MLCLLTLVDIEAVSSDTLTPWKEELLWRLYVDTYNHLTLGYADELIQQDPAGLAVVIAGRPDDISELELTQFLGGLPRRYLALFGLATIYRHVRLARGIHRDEVHASLENHDDIWELTIVTLDKPFLFSNIAGVLSYFGMDIHRGQAMTTPEGLVLDVFEFSDAQAFLRRTRERPSEICRMLDRRRGRLDRRADAAARPRDSLLYRRRNPEPPRIHFDNEHSRKYTVLEIITDDAPGPAVSDQPRRVGAGLRRRSRADRHRREKGDRRASRHQGGAEAGRDGPERADRGSRARPRRPGGS